MKQSEKERDQKKLQKLLESLINQKLTLAEIQENLSNNGHKMCTATLYNNIKRFNLPIPISEKKKEQVRRDLEILEYYNNHSFESLREVSTRFNLSHEAVRKILVKMSKCKEQYVNTE
jgi:Mor family transcriptional regulator